MLCRIEPYFMPCRYSRKHVSVMGYGKQRIFDSDGVPAAACQQHASSSMPAWGLSGPPRLFESWARYALKGSPLCAKPRLILKMSVFWVVCPRSLGCRFALAVPSALVNCLWKWLLDIGLRRVGCFLLFVGYWLILVSCLSRGGSPSALTSLFFSSCGIACSSSVVLMVAQALDSTAVTFLDMAIAASECALCLSVH